jgi:hypothetical protein
MKVLRIIGLVVLGIVGLAVFACVLGLAVMWLWNWLMPDLFGLHALTFWQAVGLLVLCHLLFRGHAFGGHAGRLSKRGRERRERFRRLVHGHLGDSGESQREAGQATP